MLSQQQLKTYFIDHFNRIYCGKQHIVSRFPEFVSWTEFKDIRLAIEETTEDVQKQIARINAIYNRLDERPQSDICPGLIAMLDEASIVIAQQKYDATLRDMAILFYLQNIESTEIAPFQVLRMVASTMNDPETDQLLWENLDEARDDRNLLLELTKKIPA